MLDRTINVQDAFLNYVRRNRVPVTVFLHNGVKLNGIVSCFDRKVVIMRREGCTQLIYKHAISTFSSRGSINVFEGQQRDASVACSPESDTEMMYDLYDEDEE